jgi:hypothetical protein
MLRRRFIATLVVVFVGTALATPLGAANAAKKKLKTLHVLVTNDDARGPEDGPRGVRQRLRDGHQRRPAELTAGRRVADGARGS